MFLKRVVLKVKRRFKISQLSSRMKYVCAYAWLTIGSAKSIHPSARYYHVTGRNKSSLFIRKNRMSRPCIQFTFSLKYYKAYYLRLISFFFSDHAAENCSNFFWRGPPLSKVNFSVKIHLPFNDKMVFSFVCVTVLLLVFTAEKASTENGTSLPISKAFETCFCCLHLNGKMGRESTRRKRRVLLHRQKGRRYGEGTM